MSFEGNYWGPDGALAKARRASRELRKKGDKRGAVMVLVSPYLSAANRLRAELREPTHSFWDWMVVVYYVQVSFRAAVTVYRKRHVQPLTGAEWSTVLPLLSLPLVGPVSGPEKLRLCVEAATSRLDCSPHDRALMWLYSAECWSTRRDACEVVRAHEGVDKARAVLAEHEFEMPRGQLARIYRAMARIYGRLGSYTPQELASRKAFEYAKELPDQLVKLRADEATSH